jgi:hypothetical protein
VSEQCERTGWAKALGWERAGRQGRSGRAGRGREEP